MATIGLGGGELEGRLRTITRKRDNFDVAHSSLQFDLAESVTESLKDASIVARDAIEAYTRHLRNGGVSLSPG
jgi:hypothetical protein